MAGEQFLGGLLLGAIAGVVGSHLVRDRRLAAGHVTSLGRVLEHKLTMGEYLGGPQFSPRSFLIDGAFVPVLLAQQGSPTGSTEWTRVFLNERDARVRLRPELGPRTYEVEPPDYDKFKYFVGELLSMGLLES